VAEEVKHLFAGQTVDSVNWMNAAKRLFGDPSGRDSDGEAVYYIQPGTALRFWCDQCEQSFDSVTTPQECPHCNKSPGDQGATVTHRGHSAKTFPFAV
jgi:rubrerythrin